MSTGRMSEVTGIAVAVIPVAHDSGNEIRSVASFTEFVYHGIVQGMHMSHRDLGLGESSLTPTAVQVTLSTSLSPTNISAIVATTSSHYPVTTEAWTTYSTPQGVSPSPYDDSLPLPGGGSGGYPSDTEWSAGRNSFSHSPASGFDMPMQDTGMGSHGYNTPYNYPYHSDFETAATQFLDTTAGRLSSGHSRQTRNLEPSSSSRTRRRYPLSPPPPTPSTRSSALPKLRSASRASKNNHLNPSSTEEERKNRASHNQVEKQYRNRLNAHFEALLNTLPDYARGGDREDGEDGDRKISKAEVLEMARRHIISLERDFVAVEGERDELRETVERLRWFVAKSEEASGKAIGGTAT